MAQWTFRTKEAANGIKAGDLLGKRRILGHAFSISKSNGCPAVWAFVVQCSCGRIEFARAANLQQLSKEDQGCKECAKPKIGEKNRKHGESRAPLYLLWISVKDRCFNENNKDYKNYGKRGISVYEAWLRWEAFRDWALENGYEEGMQIHRLDNDFGYVNSNCVWLTEEDHRRIKHTRRNNDGS